MSGAELFDAVERHAKSVAYWRQRAKEAGERERAGLPLGQHHLTRRQCLARVRYGQARIVDLAITAEWAA